ncbi:hypothetical protein CISG_06387 [Coccidioides immitis RMSCC 3703]|uniref:Uncharacterized protein n=2 Tax=Coccidioides immitis TaxID=5501 RepID=A0A0J8QY03_COCIT|nr:hypothetical protein CIRG_01531 [Coccidioides immitis RMSCC 2394]KMU77346.1 hypothetical protein CISG_06387 [Coccidioides immitis RMSCC 3703]
MSHTPYEIILTFSAARFGALQTKRGRWLRFFYRKHIPLLLMQQRQDTVTSRALVPQQGNVFWNGDEEPHCFYGQNVLYFSEPHLGVVFRSSSERHGASYPCGNDRERSAPATTQTKTMDPSPKNKPAEPLDGPMDRFAESTKDRRSRGIVCNFSAQYRIVTPPTSLF